MDSMDQSRDQYADEILINTYLEDTVIHIRPGDESNSQYTGESLCYLACQRCGIGPVAAPLFALCAIKDGEPDKTSWLSPNALIHVERGGEHSRLHEYKLRWRFAVPWKTDGQDSSQLKRLEEELDERAVAYIFNQCQYDFIHHIGLQSSSGHDSKSLEWCTGIAVLVVTRSARIHNLDEKELKQRYHLEQLLPEGVLKNNFKSIVTRSILKAKLESDFWKAVREYCKSGYSIPILEWTYIDQILQEYPPYTREKYTTVSGEILTVGLNLDTMYPELCTWDADTSSVGAHSQDDIKKRQKDPIERVRIEEIENGLSVRENKKTVKFDSGPTRKPDSGDTSQVNTSEPVSLGVDSGQELIQPTDNSDDEDDTVPAVEKSTSIDYSVQVCCNYRKPMEFKFHNRDQAESFGSCILGYFRLSVNWHNNISSYERLHNPSLLELKRVHCFGPFLREWCGKRLKQLEPGCYLIKQSRQHYDSYVIVVLKENKNIEYILIKKVNGLFYILASQDAEVDLNAGFNTLRDVVSGLIEQKRLKGPCVHPDYYQEEGLSNTILLCNPMCMPSRQGAGAPVTKPIVEQKSPVTVVQSVVTGHHTLGEGRCTYTAKTGDKAVKLLDPKHDNDLKWFQRGIQRASFWHSSCFVQIDAICLSPFQVFMEAMSISLENYLRLPSLTSDFLRFYMIKVAEQITNAIVYLEKKQRETQNTGLYVHGNIRSRNILLKLADNSLAIDRAVLADPGLGDLYNEKNFCRSNPEIHRERLPWIAPERYYCATDEVTIQSDVFSLGVTLWEAFSRGQTPLIEYQSSNEVMEFYNSGKRLPMPVLLAPDPKDLDGMAKAKKVLWNTLYAKNKYGVGCLEVDPSRRPDPNSILKDIRQALFGVDLQSYVNPTQPLVDVEIQEEPIHRCGEMTLPEPIIPKLGVTLSGLDRAFKTLAAKRDLPPLPFKEGIIDERNIKIATENGIPIILGEGHYGKVTQGWYFKDSRRIKVAIKEIKGKENDYKEFEEEIKIMAKLDNEFVAKTFGPCYIGNSNDLRLVMEYHPHCLRNLLAEMDFSLVDLMKFAINICKGMVYISSQKIVHRDLAARNILTTEKPEYQVKITDFGLSRIMEDKYNLSYVYKVKRSRNMPALWSAPEGILHYQGKAQKIDSKSDIWSYGIALWEIFSKAKVPRFDSMSEKECFLAIVNEHRRLDKPQTCPTEVYDVMRQCWQLEPKNRPTFDDLLTRLGDILDRLTEPAAVSLKSVPQQLLLSNQPPSNNTDIKSRPLPKSPLTRGLLDERDIRIAKSKGAPIILGEGHYGKVVMGFYENNSERIKVAIKEIKGEDADFLEFEAEIKLMAKLDNDFVARIIGPCYMGNSNELRLVMEYHPHCLRRLLAEETFSLPDLVKFAIDICKGMVYISSQKIVHRDLATRNILTSEKPEYQVKITDFGLSRIMEDKYNLNYVYKVKKSRNMPALWSAPEAMVREPGKAQKMDTKSDVWSYGVVLWEIFSRASVPYLLEKESFTAANIIEGLSKGTRLPKPDGCPIMVYHFMNKCWKLHSKDRPTFADLLSNLQDIHGEMH